MTKQTKLGGTFTLPGTSISLYRMGYGAMQLAGPQVWGPPRDVHAAMAVLWEAIASEVNHLDTSDFYRPAYNQSDYQAGASSLPGWLGHCHQSGLSPWSRQIMDSGPFASGDH